jgi:hypothetical protein
MIRVYLAKFISIFYFSAEFVKENQRTNQRTLKKNVDWSIVHKKSFGIHIKGITKFSTSALTLEWR